MNLHLRKRATAQAQALDQAAVLPDTPLSPRLVQRGLRLSMIEGALSNIHITVCGGAFVTGFALLLGAGDFELSLIAALPFFGQLCQFVGAYLEERLGKRRPLVVWSAGISRSLWALIAVLPFLVILGPARLPLFLLIMTIAQGLIGITGNAWTSWMSALVPPRQRGRYFGIRNTICSITAMIGSWVAGYTLDYYQGNNAEAWGYALIFGAGVAAALAGVTVLNYQPEPPMQRVDQLQLRKLFTAPLHHVRFRNLCMAASAWALMIGLPAPFYNAFGIQNLKLSFASLALMTIITSAAALVAQPIVGRLQDRYGDKRVMIWSVFGVVLLPLGWAFSTPDILWPFWLNTIGAGLFWPGINQGQLNMLMDRTPAEGRSAFVAVFAATTGLGTFISSLSAGVIASMMGETAFYLGFFELNRYTLLMIISTIGRLGMAYVFARRL